MAKTSAQLDREIAAALAKRPRAAGKSATWSKTLRYIATRAFPNYKGRKISIEVADHVDRHVDQLYYGADDEQREELAEDVGTFYRDLLYKLTLRREGDRPGPGISTVNRPHAHRGSGNLRTEIPFGSAYISRLAFMGKDGGITIYLPPIDQATIDVAVDATLEAGKPTPAVTRMIGDALEGRGVMVSGALSDAYVALVAQLAGGLSSAEAKAESY
jgi:hypothetical protein